MLTTLNTVIISIGSNENKEENIQKCRENLISMFSSIYFSSTSVTKPYGEQYKNDFLNQLALIYSDQNLCDIQREIKQLEKEIGREDKDKTNGSVKIDIDIIKWNELILKEKDWQRNYVKDLLPSLYENANLSQFSCK